VTRSAWRTAVGLLASAGLSVALLIFVGVWSMLATFIPQGDATSRAVTAWAAAYPLMEPIVRTLGLHRAFGSAAFLVAVALLMLSTAVCSWRRTKVALSRSRALRAALSADDPLAGRGLEIPCDPALGESEVLTVASDALGRLGITVRDREGLLVAVSAPWATWGSAAFHWALVALIVGILVGQLVRSDGTMAVAVGETKPLDRASYVTVQAGPWHAWAGGGRSIRVDSFDPDYKTGGLDRGAVPTVSVLDNAGTAMATQRVYPNAMLHSGSLAVSAPLCGLSVWMAALDEGGTETGRFVGYADFSQTASGGTVPVRILRSSDPAGGRRQMSLTVPLDRSGDGFGEWIPKEPSARVVVATAEGKPLVGRVLRPGEDLALPGGGAVRLLGIGWYSRLSIVDDPTIPFIYAAMVAALLGLSSTAVFRQQLIVAGFRERPDGPVLALRLNLWRNVPTDRAEIERELRTALGGGGGAT